MGYKKALIGTGVVDLATGAVIPEDSRNTDWQAYQAWLADGNTPAPAYTMTELRALAKEKLKGTANSKTDAVSGNDRAKRKGLMRAVKLIRKEAKGSASEDELAELEALEAVSLAIDQIETTEKSLAGWVDHPERTASELEEFNPETVVTWPTVPG